ncbi:hypothetical protein N2152v2_007922 [Parachlorella kessleri]
MVSKSREQVVQEFHEAVNMTSDELLDYLQSDESQGVGMVREGESESVGHQSGKHIVDILQKGDEALDEDDLGHMQKVVSYVHRHMAQQHHLQKHSVEHSRWRYSLMNWGHDPLKNEDEEESR